MDLRALIRLYVQCIKRTSIVAMGVNPNQTVGGTQVQTGRRQVIAVRGGEWARHAGGGDMSEGMCPAQKLNTFFN